MHRLSIGKKVLVNLKQWVFMPDGNNYRAVYGTVRGIHTGMDMFGMVDGRSNWWLEVGTEAIPGGAIDHLSFTHGCSFDRQTNGWAANAEFGVKEYTSPSSIYNADQ